MKTLFTQAEIQQALVNFIEAQGIVVANRNVDITFIRGRKGAGISAEVEVTDPTNRFLEKTPLTNEEAVRLTAIVESALAEEDPPVEATDPAQPGASAPPSDVAPEPRASLFG